MDNKLSTKKHKISIKNTIKQGFYSPTNITSFNTQNITTHSQNHINRISEVSYLIEPNSENNLYKKSELEIEDFKLQAQEAYKEKTRQSMQKKQLDSLIKEAVITVKQDTDIEDIEKLFNNLHKEFGGHTIFEVAIHKDEGYFYHKEEELEYRPNANMHYNKEDQNFYLDKKHTKQANMQDFEKRYNYHAHIIYSTFDLDKGSGRMNREDMRKVQTITAESLDMERGEHNSKSKRMSHWQLKEQADKVREVKEQMLKTQQKMQDKIYTVEDERDTARENFRHYKNEFFTHQLELRNKQTVTLTTHDFVRNKLKSEIKELKEHHKETVKILKEKHKLEREKLKEQGTAKRSDWAELEQKHKEATQKLHEELEQTNQNLTTIKIELETARKTILEQNTIIDTLKASKSQISPKLSYLDYSFQDLQGVNFTDKDLNNANFEGANLTNAYFNNDLSGANFKNAILNDVQFDRSTLTNTDFTNAKLYGADLTNAKWFDIHQITEIADFTKPTELELEPNQIKDKSQTNDREI